MASRMKGESFSTRPFAHAFLTSKQIFVIYRKQHFRSTELPWNTAEMSKSFHAMHVYACICLYCNVLVCIACICM
jgi:hypothetical protein